jgi:hypothetical protein
MFSGMVTASVLPTINAAASVIAALAALATILYARATVGEARAARSENSRAHAEEIAEMRSATETETAVSEQRSAMEASATAHREEMDERERAFAADLALRRLAQLEQVSGLLLHLVEVAKFEYFAPSAPVDVGGGHMVTTTRIPPIQARLRTAVAVLKELGGPDLAPMLPESGRGDKPSCMRIWGTGVSALSTIDNLVSSDPAFDLPPTPAEWRRRIRNECSSAAGQLGTGA